VHIHLPKPLHGWRQFVGEVGVIVIGILIALALEQMVERIRWHEQVTEARAAIHREMAFDLSFFADRVRVAPCIDRHLDKVAAMIDRASRDGMITGGPTNLLIPGRLTLTGDYQAQQAAQNLVHFPIGELSGLGLWYDQVNGWKDWDSKEETAWSGLQVLSHGRVALGAADIALLRRDYEQARLLEKLIVLNAQRELDRAKAMGVGPGPSRSDYVQRMCSED
jgi:hypothetical protein